MILTPYNDKLTCLSIMTDERGAKVLEADGNCLRGNRKQLLFNGVGPRAPYLSRQMPVLNWALTAESRPG
jgi:hypothetical protein